MMEKAYPSWLIELKVILELLANADLMRRLRAVCCESSLHGSEGACWQSSLVKLLAFYPINRTAFPFKPFDFNYKEVNFRYLVNKLLASPISVRKH